MVRHYKRKTDRDPIPMSVLTEATAMLQSGEFSMRASAQAFGLNPSTLRRHILRLANGGTSDDNRRTRRVFDEKQETDLVDSLTASKNVYHQLSSKNIRKLAFQFGQGLNLTMPDSWYENEMAGQEWLSAFLKRHENVVVQNNCKDDQPNTAPEDSTPEKITPLKRRTVAAFNKSHLETFFNQLADVWDRHKFSVEDVWNVDEVEITTLKIPGNKRPGAGETWAPLTICVAVNAIGNSVPPMIVFPRAHFKDYFIRDGPPGCTGTANPSGQMTVDNFHTYMNHFIKHVKPSLQQKVLLLMDDHDSHRGLKMMDLAESNGVVIVSFPPSCANRLQPLERTVEGPLKNLVSAAQEAWVRNNPGKTMTIYDLPSIIRVALPRAVTPVNILKGFHDTGISPFNRHIFSDEDLLGMSHSSQSGDFLESYIADRLSSQSDAEQNEQIPVIATFQSTSGTSTDDQSDNQEFATEMNVPTRAQGILFLETAFNNHLQENLACTSSMQNFEGNPQTGEGSVTGPGRRKRRKLE